MKIFNLNLNKFDIIVHPNSFIHSIIVLKNGIIKIVAHKPYMEIPILNSLNYNNSIKKKETTNTIIKDLNNMEFLKPKLSQFPLLKIIQMLSKKNTFFDVLLVTINDELVNLYLKM